MPDNTAPASAPKLASEWKVDMISLSQSLSISAAWAFMDTSITLLAAPRKKIDKASKGIELTRGGY